jgi:micrococcal nuclease
MRHIPGPLSSAEYKGNLKDHTLAVRIYAVDAPETAKMGNPGQPFGDAATKFVESKLLNKNITLKLLAKDRYGRALAVASYTENGLPFTKGKVMDISEELIKNGLAVVYRQGGAQYNGGIARWNALEDAAKKKKIGIWSQDAKSLQLPSEYKKKTANEKDDKSTLKPSKRGIRRYSESSVSVGN